MPQCAFIKNFRISPRDHVHRVEVTLEGGNTTRVADLVQRAFPQAQITVVPRRMLDIREKFDFALDEPQARHRLNDFLSLLKRVITMSDGLDESHALSPHSIPPESESGDWHRTSIGDLVHRAKDYNSVGPYKDRNATIQICKLVFDFVSRHPRYSAARQVAPAPSSNQENTDNLPKAIAVAISGALDRRLVVPRRATSVPAQKDYDEEANGISRQELQKGTIVVDRRLRGEVLVIDDLYRSGGTVAEVARACKSAGADAVLGLAITKTAKGTQGMRLEEWPWG